MNQVIEAICSCPCGATSSFAAPESYATYVSSWIEKFNFAHAGHKTPEKCKACHNEDTIIPNKGNV